MKKSDFSAAAQAIASRVGTAEDGVKGEPKIGRRLTGGLCSSNT